MPFKDRHPLYKTWIQMRSRCSNPNDHNYHRYGGRGIAVCERWNVFADFAEDMGEKPTISHTLDRIDNDGQYTPENCHWATKKEQQRNRSITARITVEGQTYVVAELAEKYGWDRSTIVDRASKGMTFDQITAQRYYRDLRNTAKATIARKANAAARTTCKNGHERIPENTYVWKSGRTCKICDINRRKGLKL